MILSYHERESKILTKYELRDNEGNNKVKSRSREERQCFRGGHGLKFESPISFLESLFGFD